MRRFLSLSFMSIVLSLSFALSTSPTTFAATAVQEEAVCEGAGGTYVNGKCDAPGNSVTDTIKAVANLLIFIVGIIAVIMIIIGGIKYSTSNGEQSQIASAKNTILYAIIGLIVAFMSYAIVNFVSTNLNQATQEAEAEGSGTSRRE